MVRPYLQCFLERVSECYEIIIFTSSLEKYASKIIDAIDIDKICKIRLYREQCTKINGVYVKEIKKLNRDMKSIVILDNNPLHYMLDKPNGIPIKSFYDDKNDKELVQMAYILEKLAKVPDFRVCIKEIVEDDVVNYDKAFEIFKHKDNQLTKGHSNTINNSKANSHVKILKVEKIHSTSQSVALNVKNDLSYNNKDKNWGAKSTSFPSTYNISKFNLAQGKSFRISNARSTSKENKKKNSPFIVHNNEKKVALIPAKKLKEKIPLQKNKTKSSIIMGKMAKENMAKQTSRGGIIGKEKPNQMDFVKEDIVNYKRPKSVIPLTANEIKDKDKDKGKIKNQTIHKKYLSNTKQIKKSDLINQNKSQIIKNKEKSLSKQLFSHNTIKRAGTITKNKGGLPIKPRTNHQAPAPSKTERISDESVKSTANSWHKKNTFTNRSKSSNKTSNTIIKNVGELKIVKIVSSSCTNSKHKNPFSKEYNTISKAVKSFRKK